MDVLAIGICVTLLLALRVFTAESLLSWHQDTVTVQQGSSFNVTCTASDLDFLGVVRVTLRASDGVTHTIAETTHVKAPFSRLPRYSVDYNYQDNIGNLTVIYRGVLGEDSGTLLCLRLGSDETPAYLRLHVQVPVTDLYITSVSNRQATRVNASDGVVHLREIREEGVGCIVVIAGSLTAPTLRVDVGGIDEMTRFALSDSAHKLPAMETNIVAPVVMSYQLMYVTMKPERRFNRQIVTCTAVADGFEPMSAQAVLHVEYAPVILCRMYEHYAKLSGSVTITCNVESNPSSQVTWLSSSGQPIVNSVNVTVSEQSIASDKMQVQLVFHSVSPSDFGQYYLSARNDISSVEVTIALNPAYDSNNPPPPMDKMSQFRQLMSQSPDMQAMAAMMMPSSVSRIQSSRFVGLASILCLLFTVHRHIPVLCC